MKNKLFKFFLFTPFLFSLGSCDNNDGLKLNNIFEWVSKVNVDSLESISVEKGWIGTSPQNTLISQKSTQNPEYFAKFVAWINDVKLSETTYDLVGGSYTEIIFNFKDESSEKLRINNNTICDDKNGGLKFYKFGLEVPEI